jgi:hypothetical protein
MIVRYSIFPRDGGYRVFGISPKTGEWEDCQALFGNGSLWITYSTDAEANAAIAPLVKDDYLALL